MGTYYYSTSFIKLLVSVLITMSSIILVNGNVDLIQKTCKNTKFYDLCVSSLESDTTSTHADTKGLAIIMVRVGVVNATATTSYLSSKVTNNTGKTTSSFDKLTKMVLKECAQKYSFASKSLQDSAQDLDEESYDYAYLNVMAAADYSNACHNAFKRYQNRRLVYPADLALLEDGFKHICDVVMGIIDTLVSSQA